MMDLTDIVSHGTWQLAVSRRWWHPNILRRWLEMTLFCRRFSELMIVISLADSMLTAVIHYHYILRTVKPNILISGEQTIDTMIHTWDFIQIKSQYHTQYLRPPPRPRPPLRPPPVPPDIMAALWSSFGTTWPVRLSCRTRRRSIRFADCVHIRLHMHDWY